MVLSDIKTAPKAGPIIICFVELSWRYFFQNHSAVEDKTESNCTLSFLFHDPPSRETRFRPFDSHLFRGLFLSNLFKALEAKAFNEVVSIVFHPLASSFAGFLAYASFVLWLNKYIQPNLRRNKMR